MLTENDKHNKLWEVVNKNKKALLEAWLQAQGADGTLRLDLTSEEEMRRQSAEFLDKFAAACSSSLDDINTEQWRELRAFLGVVSRKRALQGFTPAETSTYVFSLKQPLFAFLRQESSVDTASLIDEIWTATALFDKLGLYTFEEYQKGREDVIKRQQQEMLELSTPVVKIWEGILVVPLIGTLDSERTQVMMESLLQSIVDTGSRMAIVDISGVPTVDTLVAQYLLKMVSAATLMGASCVICGIRPQIAQTMVQLGISFEGVVTRASLADALYYAFSQLGLAVESRQQRL